jgi:alanine-synthesizing transaminase
MPLESNLESVPTSLLLPSCYHSLWHLTIADTAPSKRLAIENIALERPFESLSHIVHAQRNLPMIAAAQRTANFDYAIRSLVRAARALERQGREVTYLNIGDPQAFGFRPPEHIIEPVRRALKDKFTGYAPSAGLLEAREAVAAYATSLGAPTSAEEVVLTSGASEAAELVLTALVNNGDEVLLPAPGYPIYPAILNKLGADSRPYRLDPERNWEPFVDEVRSLINKRTRALVLINPNNPTGSVTPNRTTYALLKLAAEHKLPVISDEVYRDLCFTETPSSASTLADSVATPVITLESLSKTHMVPGWRVGWMRFTNPEKMQEVVKAVAKLASGRLCSPTPTQYAVRPALQGSKEFLKSFVEEIKNRRDYAAQRIEAIAGLHSIKPAAAFYMMIKVADLAERTDERFVLNLLDATGVLVVHGSGFGMDPFEGYFRLVYLASEEVLKRTFDAVERFIR